MSNFPAPSSKQSTRRVILADNGQVYTQWVQITPDDRAILDHNWHNQLESGTWRFVYEVKTTTIEYTEA